MGIIPLLYISSPTFLHFPPHLFHILSFLYTKTQKNPSGDIKNKTFFTIPFSQQKMYSLLLTRGEDTLVSLDHKCFNVYMSLDHK